MLMAENLLLMRRRYRTSVSAAALFLAAYGPLGMVLDFADASVAIVSSGGSLDYQSQGQVSNGALVGPGAKLTNTAPSLKLTEQADGNLGFQAHNLYLNSAAPANQSVTTGMLTGATYAITLTGSVSITLSGAATGTITAGTTTFTAASGTLTCGSTSGSGTVHLRRTPSVDTYVATAGAQVYDLPYVYSGGVRQGIAVEPAATNLMLVATPSSGHSNITWSGNTLETLDPAGTNTASKMTTTATAATNIVTSATVTATSCTASVYIKATTSGLNRFALRNATTATMLLAITISDFSTGAFSYNTGSAGAGVEVLNNGWLRVVLSASAGITSGDSIQFYTGALGSSVAAGQVLYIWCRQLETGAVATSPIITYGSPVLRAIDNITIATSLIPHTATEGTMYAQYVRKYDLFSFAAQLDDGTNANSISLVVSDTADSRNLMSSGGALQANVGNPHATAGVLAKQAISWAANRANNSTNGSIGTEDTSVTVPTVNTLRLGDRAGGGRSMTGVISKIAYFPRRFSDAELQAVTA